MGNDNHYEGTVLSAGRDFADIGYERGAFRAYSDQLKGLRLGKGFPVSFMFQHGEAVNIDIDGSRIPSGRVNGRVLWFDDQKNLGALLDDANGIEVIFHGDNIKDTYPSTGTAFSYKLYRTANRICPTEIRKV
jgi:cold shock CspA family protein